VFVATLAQRPLRVTERLKKAREARDLSLRQLAEVTKVSSRVIAALEDARLDVVPEGIYRRSLVRLLASEVGLDPEATLREFLEEFPDELPAPGSAAVPPEAARQSPSVWRRAFTMIGAVVPLLVGVAYVARPTAPTPVREVPPRSGAKEPGSWRPEIVPAGGFSEAPPPSARPISLLVTVSAPCALRIVADGALLVDRPFELGESTRVAFSDAVELSGDNAGVVQYSLNGRAGRMLGGAGEMLSVRIGREDYPIFLADR
jgi:transcriptional regulator with XRE-family HTH domain